MIKYSLLKIGKLNCCVGYSRLEKCRKENNKLDWFGESDNRDCVRVDKNGLGLQRLWLQQLCEFNLSGLQMAEAITAVYPSPQALFKVFALVVLDRNALCIVCFVGLLVHILMS